MRRFLISIGLGDKEYPGEISSSRVLGLLWGLTAIALAFILVLGLGSVEHLLVAEFIAGSAAALAFRNFRGRNKNHWDE